MLGSEAVSLHYPRELSSHKDSKYLLDETFVPALEPIGLASLDLRVSEERIELLHRDVEDKMNLGCIQPYDSFTLRRSIGIYMPSAGVQDEIGHKRHPPPPPAHSVMNVMVMRRT